MSYLTLNLHRRWALRRTPAGPLRDYLGMPFPKPSADYWDLVLLAVDIETTGLDPKRNDILSLGWVSVRRNRIDLGDACHRLVRTARAIPEVSAVVHRITDDQAARGGAPGRRARGAAQEAGGKGDDRALRSRGEGLS